MLPERDLLQLPRSSKAEISRTALRKRCAIAAFALILGSLQLSPAPSQSSDQLLDANSTTAKEPITPIPEPETIDPLKIKLGERLFGDPRLSHDNSHSCASCHDLRTNGASRNSHDIGLDGSELPLNTPTVFNAALSFRFGWEGKLRTLESDINASLENPRIMGTNLSEIVEKLNADAGVRREFVAAFGGGPNASNVVDAIARFERTLVTPGSRFDHWLAGDPAALSASELNGYIAIQIPGMRLLSPGRQYRRQPFRTARNLPPARIAAA